MAMWPKHVKSTKSSNGLDAGQVDVRNLHHSFRCWVSRLQSIESRVSLYLLEWRGSTSVEKRGKGVGCRVSTQKRCQNMARHLFDHHTWTRDLPSGSTMLCPYEYISLWPPQSLVGSMHDKSCFNANLSVPSQCSACFYSVLLPLLWRSLLYNW